MSKNFICSDQKVINSKVVGNDVSRNFKKTEKFDTPKKNFFLKKNSPNKWIFRFFLRNFFWFFQNDLKTLEIVLIHYLERFSSKKNHFE